MVKKIIIVLAAALCFVSCGNGKKQQVEEPEPIPPIGFRYKDYQCDTTKVMRGESLAPLLKRLGLNSSDTYTMTTLLDTVFNPRRMQADQMVEAYYSADDSLGRKLEYVVYHNNKIKYTVFKCADSLCLWNYYRPVVKEEKYLDVTIHSSLWNDTIDAGGPAVLIGELSDIFAWTVNFFGLQEGDRFQTVYTQNVCEGEVIGLDRIDFSRYTRGGEEVCAIRIDVEGTGDRYYNRNGDNLRKAFLKAPLKFTRVSSKFTMTRKHPVTGKVRPHTGVDYAAPAGTPVHALGDGVVISAGWTDTGGGNVIKIQHNSTYTTGYLHLKGFAKGIRKGVRVKQGQTIGYVGSTGLSTGPHLDFRVWKNGQPIDPLKMKSPSADPLPAAYKPQLDSLYHHFEQVIGAK